MGKIIDLKQAISLSKKLKTEHKTLVIAGGCFDILHVGHIRFFQKAKQEGDILCILLEDDRNVKKLKGKQRPINSQKDRAEILSSISFIDYIIPLKNMTTDEDYDNLLIRLKPDIIATTENDPQGVHNERQSKLINAKVKYVIQRINNKSTSNLAKRISEDF
jgi:FAD synthetase